MAHIHGKSNCTKFLLNGVRPINGKKPATLAELHHLYDNYKAILNETALRVTQKQDDLILSLSNDESRLDRQIADDIAKRTIEVESHIQDLHDKIEAGDSMIRTTGYLLRYAFACLLSSHRIHSPSAGAVRELSNIRYRKEKTIANKSSTVTNECNNIKKSYDFLKEKESFLIGADGEEFVIHTLTQLPDEYHIVNDVNLHFDRAIHWREQNEWIKNCQIDHVVVGPTGIFLLETKNWKSSDIELKSKDLRHQVRRSSLGFWFYLKDHYTFERSPKTRSVIVSMKGNPSGNKPDKYIDVVSPYQLCRYISGRPAVLDENAIKKVVNTIS